VPAGFKLTAEHGDRGASDGSNAKGGRMAWKNGRCALAALAFAATYANADVPEPLDRINLAIGGFYPTVDTRISANGPGFAGTDVGFQRDLGLDKHRMLASARLEFLVFDSQGFSIGGYRYSKGGATTLARNITFDGSDYDINAFVRARFQLDTVNAAWHWWFTPGLHDAIGVGLGAAYYDLKGTIDGGVSVNGGSTSGRSTAEGDAIAPLLTFGWRHAFSANFRGYADFSGVRKPSGTLTGHLLNGTLGLEYYPWRHLGLALEYSANNLDLKADKESWEGRARIHFHGPAAYVRARF
jgi:hypothetical protein